MARREAGRTGRGPVRGRVPRDPVRSATPYAALKIILAERGRYLDNLKAGPYGLVKFGHLATLHYQMEVVAMPDREKLEKAIERRQMQERERQTRANEAASGSGATAENVTNIPMESQEEA